MTATTIRVQMAQRKDTAANWTAANPILLSGEIGYETDTKKFKIGNGSTNWNSLAYLPIPDGSGNLTITGNLEIGSTGSLTFEGSTADGFETTLAVTNPTADRTITLPNQSGNVLVSGNASIIDADIAANAEIAVSKLADGTARQLLQTDAAGTGVEWASNVDIPGTLDVTGAATFDAAVTVAGDLTVNGTTTTISTQNLLVEDKNIIIGDVAIPTDVTADGGGITLKGATDKTINWVDATDAWTSSERFSVPLSTAALPSLTFTGDPNTGIYSPGADQVAISTNSTGRLFIDSSGRVGVGGTPNARFEITTGAGTEARITSTIDNNADLTFYTNGVQRGIVEGNSLGLVLGTTGALPSVFVTNNTERLRITAAGLVGIGTSSPGGNLDVRGLSGTTIIRAVGADTNGNADAEIFSTGTTGNSRLYFSDTAAQSGSIIYSHSANSFSLATNANTAVTIDSSQRVGIGSNATSPTQQLHVKTDQAAYTWTRIDNQSSSASAYSGLALAAFGNTWGLAIGSSSANSNALAFVLDATNTNSEKMRLDTSGRLLVGTSSQSGGALLQVNGDRVRIATAKTPASATDTGTAGEICWDASYVYVCTATNTWKRSALTTW